VIKRKHRLLVVEDGSTNEHDYQYKYAMESERTRGGVKRSPKPKWLQLSM
jgi:hypothetical protein